MATQGRVVATDLSGLPVDVIIDLEKPIQIVEIPEDFEFAIETKDEYEDGETVEYIGARPKRD